MRCVNIHMKNVNGVYFRAEYIYQYAHESKCNVYIYIHRAAYCLSPSCVLLSTSFMCMMM